MQVGDFFKTHPRTVVAFSGGVDSAVVLLLAARHAREVRAYYVKSPFQPRFELADARQLAADLAVDLEVISLDVLADDRIAANPPDRCYYCKRRIFEAIRNRAAEEGFRDILDGTNASDDPGDRPGVRALQELQILSPLRDCGLTKENVRQLAREAGLAVADKPSYACLATRIPSGTPITADCLARTEQAEDMLRAAGFRNFRIRQGNGYGRLELGRGEFDRFAQQKDRIYAALAPLYGRVYLDLKERADE